ncbi:MAG: ribose 5-phosphate isomerase B [Candidatus Saccharibacteria bacterium]
MKKLKIGIACDHAGFERKQPVMRYLQQQGIEYKDFGAYSEESSDYADFAHPLAQAVADGEFDLGITLCGSGNGINMTANKHRGIRSAICWMPEIAALARQHNDANICSLPARYITDEQAVEIVKTFLSSEFEGGRHQRRIDKIPC